METIDLYWRTIQRNLYYHIHIELVIELYEHLRTRVRSQLQEFFDVDLADVVVAAVERGGGRDVEVVVLLMAFDVCDIITSLLGVDADRHLRGSIGLDVEAEEKDLIGDEDLDETLSDLHLPCSLFNRSEFIKEVWSYVLLLLFDFLCLLGQQRPVHCDGILDVSVVDIDWILG